MAQNNMIAQATQILSDHKANKKLSIAVLALLEEFSKKSKLDTTIRNKNITLDGNDYRWCNRHEVYEPVSNFKEKDSCKLAVSSYRFQTKNIKTLSAAKDKMIEEGEMENVQAKHTEIKLLMETRGARYDFEANKLQFPEIADYIYDQDKFLTDEEGQAL